MTPFKALCLILFALLLFPLNMDKAEARRRRRFRGIPTHPIYLWAKTISTSKDDDQRKVAAFKLSQYSQPIYQVPVINALLGCIRDKNLHIKVLCTKALGRSRKRSKASQVRNALIRLYKKDEFLRNTVVRTFIALEADEPRIHNMILDAAKKSQKPGELVVLMSYLEQFGSGSKTFLNTLIGLYNKADNNRVKTAIVKTLGERANGEPQIVNLLAQCTSSKDTPLVLTCLAGLEAQGTQSTQAWQAVENTIQSSDPDVLEATLDVMESMPENPNENISNRLLQIIGEAGDSQIKEKAVLALGICGNQSSDIVEVLKKLVEENSINEDIRVAAALVLGKQASQFPRSPTRTLASCSAREKSQNLRTACQLGLQELRARVAKARKNTDRATASKP